MNARWQSVLMMGGALMVMKLLAADPVFDVKALTATPLDAQVLKKSAEAGIVTEEVMFHSEMDGAKRVDIFAFLVYPEGAKGLPAFIWNQGGLGRADTHLITHYGAKRGYAALCIDFPLGGYRSTGGYNIVSGLASAPDPHQAPIYHGAVALLKAVSYLQTRPEVDPQRIGMSGSSWGGFYTTLMAGVDPRLKAAAPMFGCGFLHTGNSWWGAPGGPVFPPAAEAKHWLETLDPGPRLAQAKTPIAWFTGTNDGFYWLPSVVASYSHAAGPRHLALLPNWNHGLSAELDDQVFTWLDIHLKGAPAFLGVTPLEVAAAKGQVQATWRWSGPRKFARAWLMLSYGQDTPWSARYWATLPATVADDRCTVPLPKSPLDYWIGGAVVDQDGFLSSTPILLVETAKHGLADPQAKLDYDGASMWGDFEEAQVSWLSRMGAMQPDAVATAKQGKQAARLPAGTHRLGPLYGTAKVLHHFACWLKSEKPAAVTIALRTSGQPPEQAPKVTAAVKTDWTECRLDVVFPADAHGGLVPELTIPQDASVLLDAVTFRP